MRTCFWHNEAESIKLIRILIILSVSHKSLLWYTHYIPNRDMRAVGKCERAHDFALDGYFLFSYQKIFKILSIQEVWLILESNGFTRADSRRKLSSRGILWKRFSAGNSSMLLASSRKGSTYSGWRHKLYIANDNTYA